MSFFANLLGEVESKPSTVSPTIPSLSTGPAAKSSPTTTEFRSGIKNGAVATSTSGADRSSVQSTTASSNPPDKATTSNGSTRPKPSVTPDSGVSPPNVVKRKADDHGNDSSRLSKSPKVSRTRSRPTAAPAGKMPSLAALARLTSSRSGRASAPASVSDEKTKSPVTPTPPELAPAHSEPNGNGVARSAAKPAPVAAPVVAGRPTPASNTSCPPPAKGSYMELLARAAASKATAQSVGSIVNKPREVRKPGQKAEPAAPGSRGVADAGKPSIKDPKKPDPRSRPAAVPAVKKPVDPALERKAKALSYKGTMGLGRPSSGSAAAAGSGKLGNGSRAGRGGVPQARLGGRRYEDEAEDSYDSEYDSEGSIAMETSAFELEQEEQTSLHAAIKDDWELEREQAAYDREKERQRQLRGALSRKK